ncbi:MAG: hypothetical protein R3C11_16530 [Planctomycetaceae bacterium]
MNTRMPQTADTEQSPSPDQQAEIRVNTDIENLIAQVSKKLRNGHARINAILKQPSMRLS